MKEKKDAQGAGPDRMAAEGGDQCLVDPELETVCAGCGAEKADWNAPEGVKAGGTTYCSQRCADKVFSAARGKASSQERKPHLSKGR